ncbi:MAG: serine/threonine-protein kinase, partial [Acidobacteriota bacterium]
MDAPRTIGKYEILERIGQGGFGLVYKGRDPFIKRLVAVKLCTSSDETLRKRFVREAEIAGNLHHRYIVTVFEFGYDDAGPFLIQEYLPGEDLDHKIQRREPLDQATRLGYLLQIARALDYAHKKGVLHRDVKPGNVRVLEDGRIKILDFGIAKLAGAETQLTRTGRVLGTAGYLSPEQLKGEVVDGRSDVFSFGVLAYELLAYEHPFPGTTISELLDRVVHSDPRPLPVILPDCPAEIGLMVAR